MLNYGAVACMTDIASDSWFGSLIYLLANSVSSPLNFLSESFYDKSIIIKLQEDPIRPLLELK